MNYWVKMEIDEIRRVIEAGQHRFRSHAEEQADLRNIRRAEVEEAILTGAIFAEYLEHYQGPCCLAYGQTSDGRHLHIVVSLPPQCWIITAYEPDPEHWIDHRTRRASQ